MKRQKYDIWRKQYPYYKVQWYDERSKVWRDIQHRHFAVKDAEKARKTVKLKTRIMKVDREGRSPL